MFSIRGGPSATFVDSCCFGFKLPYIYSLSAWRQPPPQAHTRRQHKDHIKAALLRPVNQPLLQRPINWVFASRMGLKIDWSSLCVAQGKRVHLTTGRKWVVFPLPFLQMCIKRDIFTFGNIWPAWYAFRVHFPDNPPPPPPSPYVSLPVPRFKKRSIKVSTYLNHRLQSEGPSIMK